MADDTLRRISVQLPEERRLNSPLEDRHATRVPKEHIDSRGLARDKTPPAADSRGTQDLNRDLRAAPELARRMFRRDMQATEKDAPSGQSTRKWVASLSKRLTTSRLNAARRELTHALTARSDPLSNDAVRAGTLAAARSVRADSVAADLQAIMVKSSNAQQEGQAQTVSVLSSIHAFQAGPQLRHMTNSLTAQYQGLYLQKAAVKSSALIAQILDQKLEAIKHNTAASEIRKRTIMDIARDTLVRTGSEAAMTHVTKAVSTHLGPLFTDKVVNPLKGMGSAWADSEKMGAATYRKFSSAALAAQAAAKRRVQEAQDSKTTVEDHLKTAGSYVRDKMDDLGQKAKEAGASVQARATGIPFDELQDRGIARMRALHEQASEKLGQARDTASEAFSHIRVDSIGQEASEDAAAKSLTPTPLLTEVESLHSDFSDHARHVSERGDQIVQLLAAIAEGSLSGAHGEGGGVPRSGAPWWRRSITDIVGGIGRGGMALAKMYTRGVGGAIGVLGKGLGMLNPLRQMATEPFVDVYRKGEVSLGNPLVTARQLRAGLIFTDGEPVGDVADIDRPVIHPASQQVLISQEDIDHGLVDVHGTPLSKRGATTSIAGRLLNVASGLAGTAGGLGKHLFSSKNPLWGLYGKLFETMGSVVGSFGSVLGGILSGAPSAVKGLGSLAGKLLDPLIGAYKGMFNVGLDAVRMGMSGAGKLLGRMFGFEVGGAGSGIKRKDLEEVVGDRLDDIYGALMDFFHNKPKSTFDTDQDGDRDGSYADYKQRMAERKAKRAAAADGTSSAGASAAAKSSGILAALSGMFGGRKKSESSTPTSDAIDKENAEGGDGGGMVETAAGIALGAAAPNILKRAKGAIKKGAGKVFGKSAEKVATKTAAKVAKKAGTKAASKVVVKTLGKSLTKKIPILGALAGAYFASSRLREGDVMGALAEFASGLVSIVPVAGTAASIALDSWLAYRDITKGNAGASDLLRYRLEAYGVQDSQERTKAIVSLEQRMYAVITDGDLIPSEFIKSIMPDFGFDPTNEDHYGYFAGWLRHRVRAIYSAYLKVLHENEVNPEAVSNIDDDTARLVIQGLAMQTRTILDDRISQLTPDMKAYMKITGKGAPEVKPLDAPDLGFKATTVAPKRRQTEAQRRRHASSAAPQSPGGSSQSATAYRRGRRAGRMGSPAVHPTSRTPRNMPIAKGRNGLQSGVDMSSLGSLSAQFESSRKGSMAIGYDKHGGTSYGKYQLSSNSGTFGDFLRWLNRQGGDAKEIAQRLINAGAANTGSTRGAVPDEWMRIVSEGLMGDYEHEFIKATHYDKVLTNASDELKSRITASPTLQNVVWSTAVQHGPDDALTLLERSAYGAGEKDDAVLIRKLYEDRSGQFDSSTPGVRQSVYGRLQLEENTALAALEKEGSAAAKDLRMAKALDLPIPKYESTSNLPTMGDKPVSAGAPKTSVGDIKVPAVTEAATDKMPNSRRPHEAIRVAHVAALKSTPAQPAALAAAPSVSATDLHVAVAKANGASVDQLTRVNAQLTTLTNVMAKGLGDDGSLSKFGKAVAESNNHPIIVQQAMLPQPAANSGGRHDRLRAAIDMKLERGGNDASGI